MAESGLSLTYVDLMSILARHIGWGYRSTVADGLSAAQVAELDRTVQEAYRTVLSPPDLPDYPSYDWSWLHPVNDFQLFSTVTEAVVGSSSYSDPDTTVVLNTAVIYPTMAGHDAVVVDFEQVPHGTYPIHDTNSDVPATPSTGFVTVGDITGTVDAPDLVTITADGNYTFPDDFGGLEGPMTFTDSGERTQIDIVSEFRIRQLRQVNPSTTSRPQFGAIVPRAYDETRGQGYELRTWPYSTATAYTVRYGYHVIPTNSLSVTNLYPLGGVGMAAVYRAAVLSIGELEMLNSPGIMTSRFQQILMSAVRRDAKLKSPHTLGYNHGRRHSSRRQLRILRGPETIYITTGGVAYPS